MLLKVSFPRGFPLKLSMNFWVVPYVLHVLLISVITRERTSLPEFGHCGVGLAWCVMGGEVVVVVDLGFTTLLTSQVISVAFYSEREKSDKFCSEALISAWGSFKCRKSTTRDPGFTSLPKEVILRIFTFWKIHRPWQFWTREPRIQWRVW